MRNIENERLKKRKDKEMQPLKLKLVRYCSILIEHAEYG